jgi:hypothetical protein
MQSKDNRVAILATHRIVGHGAEAQCNDCCCACAGAPSVVARAA